MYMRRQRVSQVLVSPFDIMLKWNVSNRRGRFKRGENDAALREEVDEDLFSWFEEHSSS